MIRRTWAVLLALALSAAGLVAISPPAAIAAPAAVAAPASFSEIELWDAADVDPYVRLHVQAFAVVRGTTDVVLAVTEGRKTDCDCAKKDMLLRRSTDGGITWTPSTILVADNTPGDASIGSPSLLVDDQTDTAYFFWRGIGATILYKSSTDGGVTWSATTDLTSLFATQPYGWVGNGPTPGHGIQLSSGRLMMPINHKMSAAVPNYGTDVVYSDDHGATWHRSAPIPMSPDYPVGEARLYERSDGAVVINARWGAGGTHYRLTSTSTDGGTTWSAAVHDQSVEQFVAIDAGLIQYTTGAVNRILYSNPAASARENMTVSISYDEGASYRYSRVVNTGTSYYSDLAALSDGTILLIYGRDGDHRAFPERITVARFNLEWVTNGRDSLAGGPGFTRAEAELASSQAVTSTGTAQVVADANALGGSVLRYAPTTAGSYVEVPFNVSAAGTYDVGVRFGRDIDRGKIRTSIDGVNLPFGRVDPTVAEGRGYRVVPLGRHTLSAGSHTIRFTLVGAGRGGGTVITADQLMLTTTGGPAADTPFTIADNNAPANFEIVSGSWDTNATGIPGYYGQFYASHPAGTGSAKARFRPDVPMTGSYEVAVWYPAEANRATNAHYSVTHADGQTGFFVNQTGEGSRWVILGTMSFVAGDTATIDLTDDADGYVIADAVRLVRVGGVADNDSGDFSSVAGTWSPATGTAGYYGHNYRTAPAGTGTSIARWRPTVPSTGVYRILAWYPADTNRASNAPYTVTHTGGTTTTRVDQRTRGAEWVLLGYYSLTAGTATVELSNDADGYVVADAIRLDYQGTVVDNTSANFSVVSGTWNNNATSTAGYYGTNYGSSAAGTGTAKARWTLTVPAAGVYQVAVWYTADTNRASNAPYTVSHANGSTTVAVDQRTRGGKWVSLGTFTLAAGTTTVELTNNADGYVIADAVRILPIRV